jgi:hypothetical protein
MACALLAAGGIAAYAQAPGPAAVAPHTAVAPGAAARAAAVSASPALAQLAWLRGCWAGNVNRRDFVEQWLPPRADMMLGISHTTVQSEKNPSDARTEDYTYLRLEARSDGVYYVAIPSGKNELPFKLTSVEKDQGDLVFTFANPTERFPQRIVYRHTERGSLFAEVAGKLEGKDQKVIYPMHRVDCTTGEAAPGEHG